MPNSRVDTVGIHSDREKLLCSKGRSGDTELKFTPFEKLKCYVDNKQTKKSSQLSIQT